MSTIQRMSILALRQVVRGAGKLVGAEMLGEGAAADQIASLSNERQVTDQTPPCFLWHTWEDKGVPPENSVVFYQALLAHKIPAELHVYANTTHDFGVRTNAHPYSNWTETCANWLRQNPTR